MKSFDNSPAGIPPTPISTPKEERRARRSAGINTAFQAIKAQHSSNRTRMEIIADRMIGTASNTLFLFAHALFFVFWIMWNVPASGMPMFDPYPFGMLTTMVSLEAIVLSIFVLMTQSRESRIGELREELTLQVNLRIEEELTKTLHLVAGLYARLDAPLAEDPELRQMLEPLDPKKMETELSEQMAAAIPKMKLLRKKAAKPAAPEDEQATPED